MKRRAYVSCGEHGDHKGESMATNTLRAIVLLKERNTFERGAVRIVFASCPGAETVL
jgi:hypothetical protein